MPLTPGTRLGPYEIQAVLGAGGMGEVYSGRDTRLGRMVAIKVLPAARAGDPERRRRFEQEARAASALNHPHICAIYDVGESVPTIPRATPQPDPGSPGEDANPAHSYLVMELVEGETLARRIGRGPLSIEDVLRFGAQMADALAAAHHAGIVHRDLKPANVMLTKAGTKLLDFGLAKLRPTAPIGPVAETRISPAAGPLTADGIVLGTVPYMAPEQVEGREPDARADIFSLGAVLYEMATGRRAFDGESAASVMAAILKDDPPSMGTLVPLAPPALDRVVRKCLAKDPSARWQTAADLADELRWISTESAASSSRAALAPERAKRARWPWVAASGAVAIGALVFAGWLLLSQAGPTAPPPAATHTQVTFTGDVSYMALSPDGKTAAYAAGQGPESSVRVRDVAGEQDLVIWRGDVLGLRWMPDGSQILVTGRTAASTTTPGADSQTAAVWLVPRFGGPARKIPIARAAVVAVSPDGNQFAGSTQATSGVQIASVSGELAALIPVPTIRWVNALDWNASPGLICILGRGIDGRDAIWTVDPGGKRLRLIYQAAPASRILHICSTPAAGGIAYAERNAAGVSEVVRLRIGSADPVEPELVLGGLPASSGCSVSVDGQRMLYSRLATTSNLWRIDLDRPGAPPGAVTTGTGSLVFPHVSPDGRWLSVTREAATYQLVRMPVSGGPFSVIGNGLNGSWSPDGKRFAFVSDVDGKLRSWVGDADGQRAVALSTDEIPRGPGGVTWLADGRVAWKTGDARNYVIRDIETGREEFLLPPNATGWVFEPQLSPDRRRVAVFWNRKPDRGLWLLTWPERKERFLAEHVRPIGWSADGQFVLGIEALGGNSRDGSFIVRVSADTGRAERIAQSPRGFFSDCTLLAKRPVAFCAIGESSNDVWLVEHFDPRIAPPKR